MESEKYSGVGLMPVMMFLAVVASVLVLLDSGNFGFMFLVGLAFIVTLSVRVNKTVVKAYHVFMLLLLPQLVVSFCVLFKEELEPLINLASRFYTYGFENLFWGVSRTSRRLAADGYSERAREVKAFALIGFLAASLFAYRYLVVMATVGDSYKRVNRVVRTDEGWFSRNSAGLTLFLMFFFGAVFLDIYSPSCTSRCSNIQRSNFPGVFALTGFYSITFIIVGLWINSSLIRKALLKAQGE